MSPQRAGTVPTGVMRELCFRQGLDYKDAHRRIRGDGGVLALLVVAMGYRPDERLREEFAFLGDRLSVIGDADQCRDIMSANEAGLMAGLAL